MFGLAKLNGALACLCEADKVALCGVSNIVQTKRSAN